MDNYPKKVIDVIIDKQPEYAKTIGALTDMMFTTRRTRSRKEPTEGYVAVRKAKKQKKRRRKIANESRKKNSG